VGVSAAKPTGYYANDRADLVGALPRPIGRVLDVGCGQGAVGRGLRAAGAEWLSGVEMQPDAAAIASEVYDEVAVGAVETELRRLSGPFDTICCYDVLEHMGDPYTVLRRLLGVATTGARLHVSVPNARHYSLVRDLVLRGTFGYTEWGHRDSTHLRWFTRQDIVRAIAAAGWTVRSTSHPALHRSAALDRLTRGHSTEFIVGQWYVLATKAAP
jgi:2-polyprenyl-3-methyl-5-hydroxy-6-metoxy-1,4-benzoquinol methylase